METKCCTRCGEEKPRSQFHVDNHLKSGLMSACKACISKKDAEYRRRNSDKIKESQSEWRENHREEAREVTKKWYRENSEKAKEYQREYRRTPRGQAALRNMRARRRSLSQITDIDADFIAHLLQAATHCDLCGIEYALADPNGPAYRTLDHIIPFCAGGTHTQDNVRYICRHCNNTRPRQSLRNSD